MIILHKKEKYFWRRIQVFERWTIYNVKLKIAEIKKISIDKKAFTNYYNYIDNKSFDIIMDVSYFNNTLVFGYQDNLVYRVYFYSTEKEQLVNTLSTFPKSGVIDVISKDQNVYKEIIENSGYRKYAIFKRAINPRPNGLLVQNVSSYLMEKYSDDYGRLAKIKDLDDVYKTICCIFDPYTNHIDKKEEIGKLILNEQVFLERNRNAITSLLVFKIEGQKFYINYVYNSPESKPEIIHSILIRTIKQAMVHGVNYIYCWIDESNERSIRFHKRYGLEFDGLLDLIYVKK
jgi:hypothetical protein